MTTTQRPPRSPRKASSAPGPNPANRGLLLVVIAVAVGLILLVKGGGIGFDTDKENVDIGSGTSTQASSTTVTTVPAPAVTVAPASVKVVSANGSGVSGLAGKTATFLGTAGYTQVVSTDAVTPTQQTVVYFAQGFEANAKSIAEMLGLAPTQVQPLAAGAKLAKNQPADSGIVMVLGPDVQAKVTGAAPTTAAAGQTTTTAKGQTTTTAKGQTTTTG